MLSLQEISQKISQRGLKTSFIIAYNRFSEIAGDKSKIYMWLMKYIAIWLPLSLGVVMGIGEAKLVVDEAWHLAVPVALLVPAIVLFLRYPFIAILIWVVGAPFVQITPTSVHRIVYWMLHRAVIPGALITIMMADQLKIRRDIKINFNRTDLAVISAFGLLVTFIIFDRKNPIALIYEVYDRFFVAFCLYWLIRFIPVTEEDFKRLMICGGFIVIVQGVIGLMSWFAPLLLPPEWLTLQGYRTIGSYRNYSGFTVGMMSWGLLMFQMGATNSSKSTRNICFIIFGFSIISVFISFSRGSWLAGLACGVFLFLMYPKLVARLTAVMIVVMMILAAGVMADQFSWANERLEDDNTAYDRFVIYYTAWSMFKVKPFMGWGYENYDLYNQDYTVRVANHTTGKDHTSHNTYLTILVERGLVGFILYFFPLFWLLFLTIKLWPRMPSEGVWSRNLVVTFWLLILFQVLQGQFTDTKRDTSIFVTWWMALGFIAKILDSYTTTTDLIPTWIIHDSTTDNKSN